MVEKMKVSQEIADAIEYIKERNYGFNGAMSLHASDGWAFEETCPLSNLSLEQLATVLINGYEVATTPHEEIEAIYKYHYPKYRDDENSPQKHFSKGYVKGVKMTLEKLGITIKGVNDND